MKKALTLTITLVICMFTLTYGGKVKEDKARQVAQNWYRHFAPNAKSLAKIYKTKEYKWGDRTSFYIYSFDKGGFVLVSANDAVSPILGYGFDHPVPDIITNEAVKAWFDGYARQIDTAFILNLRSEEMASQWQQVLDNKFPTKSGNSVEPLLTTTWDQGCYYNELCPADAGGPCGHTWVGCTATAMAQIMKFWNYPEGGVGQNDYVGKTSPQYGQISAYFNEVDYAWNNMPDIVPTYNSDIAELMFHCGVASNMSYSIIGSGAYEIDAKIGMNKYFNYSDSMGYLKRISFEDNDWKNAIRSEMDESRPVLYVGYNNNSSSALGHAFVCDGYQDDYFHMNWGWSGSGNGYWLLDALTPGWFNFSFNQRIVVNIKPGFSDLKAEFEIKETDSLLNYQFIDFSLGNPDSCRWDFGDGGLSYLQNPYHTFDSSGNFSIILIAYKNNLTDTISRTVYISNNPYLKSPLGFVGFAGDGLFFDYDNDNDLDLLISGYPSGTLIYRNDSATFTLLDIGIPFIYPDASLDVGDYDNDGDFDILISGELNGIEGIRTKLYKNDSGIFTEVAAPFYNVSGTVSFIDYNNDGKLDVFLAGSTGYEFKTALFKNLGNQIFKEVNNLPFPLWGQGVTATWCDLDNDGYKDLIMSGSSGWNFHTKAFHNNCDDTFTELNLPFTGNISGGISCGDYDSDGDQDITFSTGTSTILYRNDSSVFNIVPIPAFTNLAGSRAKWGDFDSDGTPDLLMGKNLLQNEGNDSFKLVQDNLAVSVAIFGDYNKDQKLDIFSWGGYSEYPEWGCNLFNNMTNNTNETPSIPTYLHTEMIGNEVFFSWTPSTDNSTEYTAISYNLRIGSSRNGCEILSAPSDRITGFNRVPRPGNTGSKSSYTLKLIPNGTYYWSVQAIDNSYISSQYSAIDSFTVAGINLHPELINFNKSAFLKNSLGFTLHDFDSAYADPENVSLQSIRFDSLPNHGTLLLNGLPIVKNQIISRLNIGNLTYFTSKLTDDKFYFNAYDGNNWANNNAIVKINVALFRDINAGLMPELSSLSMGDFNNDSYLDLLTASRIYKNTEGTFQDIGISLPGFNDVSWADIDNDGELDFVAGNEIYRNLGDDNFSLFRTLAPESSGSKAFGDVNNDNYIDLAYSGEADGIFSKVLINNSSGIFNDSLCNLTGFRSGAMAWGDYDNNGQMDLAICGIINSSNQRKTIIYKNENGNLIDIQAILPGVNIGSLDWGDYDNDGDLDLLICGSQGTASDMICKVFRNDQGFFTDFDSPQYNMLPGIYSGFAKWYDYDADGKLEIIISGFNRFGALIRLTKIFKYTNHTFSEVLNTGLPDLSYSNLTIGDIDNDGYQDLVISGIDNNNDTLTRIYKNCLGSNLIESNSPPSSPINLSSKQISSGSVMLSWNRSFDNSTDSDAITYNLFIGTSPDSTQIMSPMASLTSGYRKVAMRGNVENDTSWIINNFKPGTYYWSVQAIDNSFLGGEFAPIQSFIICALPTITGPDSVCTGNSEVIYSTESSMTGYSWAISSGGDITSGAGTNSIQVTWNSGTKENVSVYYNLGSYCTPNLGNKKNVTLIPIPDVAAPIVGPTSVSPGINPIFYSIPLIENATSYIWSLPTGALGSSDSNSIVVNFDTSAISGTITVKGINQCGSGSMSTKDVTIISQGIIGPLNPCQNSIALFSYYNPKHNWFLPSKNELSMMFNNLHSYGVGNFIEGFYWSSSEFNEYAAYDENSRWRYPSQDDKSSAINVRAIRVFNSSNIYQLRQAGPGGGLIFHIVNNGTGSYTYYQAAPEDQSALSPWGSYTYLGALGTAIGTGMSNTQIILNGCNTPGIAARVCSEYSDTTTQQFSWSVPSGWSIISGQGSNQITVFVGEENGSIVVTTDSVFGEANPSTLALIVSPLPSYAGLISGIVSVCQGQNAVTYTVPSIPNATSYIWTLPTGATGNSIANSVSVNYGSSAISGDITVKGNNTCGDGLSSSLPIAVNQAVDTCVPSWIPLANLQYNMQVLAQIMIDDDVSINTNDVLGAFVGDECRGIASPLEGLGMAFLSVGSNQASGELVELKIWNSTLCEFCDAGPVFNFVNLGEIGTYENPFQVSCITDVDLNFNFGLGYTWFSQNLALENPHPNAFFEGLVACNNDRLISQSAFSLYQNDSWNGTIAALNPDNSYRLKLCEDKVFTVTAPPAEIVPIALNSGYTWMGYVPQTCLPVNVALSNMNPAPVANDRLIGQGSFALYNGSQWLGSLTTLCPGVGFVIKLANSTTLVYPAASAKAKMSNSLEADLNSPTGIKPAKNLQHSMTVLGRLELPGGQYSNNADDRVYAFSNGQCVGMANPMEAENGLIFMSVGENSDQAQQISFKIWLDEEQQLYEANETLTFVPLKGTGAYENPFKFTLGQPVDSENDWFIGEPYPNPFNEETVVPVYLTEPSTLVLKLYNTMGQIVYTTEKSFNTAGKHEFLLKKEQLNAGVYSLSIKILNQKQFLSKSKTLIID